MKNKFPVPKKPSTLIAAAIKQGYYIDSDYYVLFDEEKSQFMCHAIREVDEKDGDLVNRTVKLIESKLESLCPEAIGNTLHEVLIIIEGKGNSEYEPSFERKLKFWKDFIKELKESNQ